ncbi:MAG: aspartate/glutamate racemase family protein [Acidimicrobiia bacterium]
MRRIGLLGGMGWQSTLSYYRYLNQEVNARLGGHHSADLVIWSGDFAPMAECTASRDWDTMARVLTEAGRTLRDAGAEILVLGSNTAHVVADEVEASSGVPVINVVDATARRMEEAGVERAALLGTAAVMESGFYRDRLTGNGIDCVIPEARDRAEIDRIIFDELVRGIVDDGSRRFFVDVIDRLVDLGAEGAVLGCTELGLLLDEDDAGVPGFNTTRIHALAAVDAALR